MGRTIAAALTGEETSDIMGIASELKPENPPFDRPERSPPGSQEQVKLHFGDIRPVSCKRQFRCVGPAPRNGDVALPTRGATIARGQRHAGVRWRRGSRNNNQRLSADPMMLAPPIRKASGRRRRANRVDKAAKHIFDAHAGESPAPAPSRRTCNACFNALDRHVEASRATKSRSITTARSPRPSAPHLPRTARRDRRRPQCSRDS